MPRGCALGDDFSALASEDFLTRVSTQTLTFLRGFAAVYGVMKHTRGHFFVGGNAIFNQTSSRAIALRPSS